MRMKIKTTAILLCMLVICQNSTWSQTTEALTRLHDAIIKTIMMDSNFKEEWIITDTDFNVQLFESFRKRNGLELTDTTKKSIEQGQTDYFNYLRDQHDNLMKGVSFVKVSKQLHGNDLSEFMFAQYNSNNEIEEVFESIKNYAVLRNIIGEDAYGKILNRQTSNDILTVSPEDPSTNNNFDILVNVLEPSIMFYSSNNYYISLFGKWGNDMILLPGWGSKDYIGGISVMKNHDKWSYYSPDWSIALGFVYKGPQPFTSSQAESPLVRSGDAIYLKISAALKNKNSMHYNFSFESKMAVSEFSWYDYDFPVTTEIFSNRNYFIAKADLIGFLESDELGKFVARAGGSLYDVYHLEVSPERQKVDDLESTLSVPEKYKFMIFGELGFEKNSSNWQHSFGAHIFKDITNNDSYAGVSFKFLISNAIGFDIRFYRALGIPSYPTWRSKEYFVFSPIIRLNY